ncbi:MAG: bifunctional folylpolyglutamate synthase/dihydrofolate synthase [Bacteroidota bacterium]
MNYSETLDYLFSRLPMYQRVGPAAYKNNLDNTLQLDNFYGNPHRHFKTIHVAGTNGKGSVSHMLAAILQSAGYKTALYTSPHLKDFRERIRINGKMIPENEVVNWVENYKANDELQKIEPSFFELTVAMAFDYFAKEKVDIAIVEVGLGGRLDSTNIITPEVSIITNIGMDHTALLGDSLEAIAKEKAGIIKNKIPVVVGTTKNETRQVFTEKADEQKAPLYFADREYSVRYGMNDFEGNQLLAVKKNGEQIYRQLKLDLKGAYQQKNLPAVLKTLELLKTKGWDISHGNIETGLAEVSTLTGLLGRWQVLGANPRIVCDTAHNADGITEIVKQIAQIPYKKLHIVFGMVNDKEPEKILKLLPQKAVYYFTKAKIPRALDENVLAKYATEFGLKGQAFSDVNNAYNEAKKNAGKDDFIFVGGSTFIVAEIL